MSHFAAPRPFFGSFTLECQCNSSPWKTRALVSVEAMRPYSGWGGPDQEDDHNTTQNRSGPPLSASGPKRLIVAHRDKKNSHTPENVRCSCSSMPLLERQFNSSQWKTRALVSVEAIGRGRSHMTIQNSHLSFSLETFIGRCPQRQECPTQQKMPRDDIFQAACRVAMEQGECLLSNVLIL